ncbi:DUF7114 family protein [Halovivax gelatinilyticus]|uniref:DUF7114 family protein n=1 Tax=Halovivax gelatinilyticus TaxID=2961597 RepID=UPI0020CA80AD|nr:hypothetical protein [Halovivax gelatinilyticus]
MDRVSRCRRATREAVTDVAPPPLCDRLRTEIDAHPLTPAVLTVESALAADPNADVDDVLSLAAGTQLIYTGLALTRTLAHDEPWGERLDADGPTVADTTNRTAADLSIVAADVLVARGFSLLALTDASDRAVETVRAFGRDQTRRDNPETDEAAIDERLERDILELAVVTGAAAVETEPEPALVSFAADLADRSADTYPQPDQWLESIDAATVDGLASDGGTPDRSPSAGE